MKAFTPRFAAGSRDPVGSRFSPQTLRPIGNATKQSGRFIRGEAGGIDVLLFRSAVMAV